jgi:transcriptional regulator with XRE-family HTH domain
MNLKEVLGKNIKEERLKKGWSVEKLAENLEVSSRFLSAIERGEKTFSIENFYKAAGIFEVPMDYLLRTSNDQERWNSSVIHLMKNFSEEDFGRVIEILKILKNFKT